MFKKLGQANYNSSEYKTLVNFKTYSYDALVSSQYSHSQQYNHTAAGDRRTKSWRNVVKN